MALKVFPPERIQKLFSDLQRDIDITIRQAIELAYFMRGSVSYEYILYNMSIGERDVMDRFLDKRLSSEAKNMYPVY